MKIAVETIVKPSLPKVTFDAENTFGVDQQRQGWPAILDNFARHVEAKA